MKNFTLILFILILGELSATDNLLKVVAINYKYRDINIYNIKFSEYYKKSNSNIEITSGNELQAFQPIGIIQNVSNQMLTFKARFEIYNNSVQKLIYRRNVDVSHECLKLTNIDTAYCDDIPYIKVRYCKVDSIDGFYKSTNLPYPGDMDLIGIPPGGFVQVDFAPFFSNDFIYTHYGNCKVSLIAIPIVPETGDTLKDGNTSDDTLSFELNLVKKQCAEVYYPYDGDTIESSNNYFFALSGINNPQVRRVEFSKSNSFDKIEFTKPYLENENIKFNENGLYFWRLYIEKNDTICYAPYKSFYVKGITVVKGEENYNENSNIFPNPAMEYITVNLERCATLQKCGTSMVEIYDVMGVLVAQTPSSVFIGNKFYGQTGASNLPRIDISSLAPGVYFVKIVGSNGACSIIEKFVKY